MNELAEEQTFFVVYPAQALAANALRCWTWSSAGDRSLVAGITRQVMRDFPVDPECVYVAGFSAGGATAAIMGSEYPDLYAAVGVHSGPACRSSSRKLVPTILFHGDRDSIVHPLTVTRPSCGLRQALSCGLPLGGAKSPAGQHTPVRFTLMARDIRFWNIGFCMSLDMVGQVALRVPHRAARPRCQPRDGALLSRAVEGGNRTLRMRAGTSSSCAIAEFLRFEFN